MREPTRAGIGLALTLLGLLFGALCLTDPEVFTPVNFLAQRAMGSPTASCVHTPPTRCA